MKLPFPYASCFLVVLISSFVMSAMGQDATPTPANRGVQLEFVPPPMEGTISMGIYDSAGKLVRVLHQEAPQTDFVAALNGLITFWDGKDDTGKPMPAGKYRAKGYMAGAMDFEGVAFLGNDWIKDDDSPHMSRILGLSVQNDKPLLVAKTPEGKIIVVHCDANGEIESVQSSEEAMTKKLQGQSGKPAIAAGGESEALILAGVAPTEKNPRVAIIDGKVTIHDGNTTHTVELAANETPVTVCASRNGGAWVIVMSGLSYEVREYSAEGEYLRRLGIQSVEPQPVQIAASQSSDTIYLLEQNDKLQRVRGLTLQPAATGAAIAPPASIENGGTPANSSTWKVVFNKAITFSDKIEQVAPLLKMPDGKPFAAQEKISLKLLPNPLEQDKLGAVEISIVTDAKGSFLKAGDGLPLVHVSETPYLHWAAMARPPDSKILTIFQSDGAVVEQFKATKLANMMAFDAGDFDFDPAKIK